MVGARGGTMTCPYCGCENRKTAKYCSRCAAPLSGEVACPECRTVNLPGQQLCASCSHPLAIPEVLGLSRKPCDYTPKSRAEKILASSGALEGQRKTITALFAEVKYYYDESEESAELCKNLDPKEARRVIDSALKLMMDAVHRYEGYVARAAGNGIFALFGAPIAHENHPQRALYAALTMKDEIGPDLIKAHVGKGLPLRIRVGLNTGEVVMGSIRAKDLHADYAPLGNSISLAAYMRSMAGPDSIVVNGNTYRLAEGYFQFKALGAARVEGISEPVKTYEVIGVGSFRTKIHTPLHRRPMRFVGRTRELEQMRRAWESARAGRGQIIAITREPGVGKTRLVDEFKASVESLCLVLEAAAMFYDKINAYEPLRELLRTYFQITPYDDDEKQREKITGKVLRLDRRMKRTLPYLFALMGILEPKRFFEQARLLRGSSDAVKRLLVRESLKQPLLLVF